MGTTIISACRPYQPKDRIKSQSRKTVHFITQGREYLSYGMNILFPAESEEPVTTRMDKMDALLKDIQQVLAEIRQSLDRERGVEDRVAELERSVARLQSITMDLRTPRAPTSETDRITPLESKVNTLCTMTAEQKAVLDQLVESQGKSIQELRKEMNRHGSEDEPVIQEIDEIVRRR